MLVTGASVDEVDEPVVATGYDVVLLVVLDVDESELDVCVWRTKSQHMHAPKQSFIKAVVGLGRYDAPHGRKMKRALIQE